LCEEPCYLIDQPILSLYDSIANVAVPVGIIALANVVLVVRVLWQKRNRPDAWRRQRKLTIQLLLMAALFIIMWFPLTIIPIVLVPLLPDFRKVVLKWHNNTIVPEINNIGRLPNVEI
jgi:hypothetical protein